MRHILSTIQPVIEGTRSVKINPESINNFNKKVEASDLESSEFAKDEFVHRLTEEENIAFAFLYNSVNFSYWGNPKWTISIAEQNYDGGDAMVRALRQSIENGLPLLDAKYLSGISEKDFAIVLQGNIEIPLFIERLKMARELGEVISNNYGGSFTNFIEKAGWNAEEIVLKLVKEIPQAFNDIANYHGNTVKFYKRAQLIPAHIHDLYRFNAVSKDITRLDSLTAFADYKVPQLLRRFDILSYSPDLAEKVDNLQEIPPGSDEEIEIRAATIWAVELVTSQVRERIPTATAAQIDGVFWFKSQEKNPGDKPYHRTRTIWY